MTVYDDLKQAVNAAEQEHAFMLATAAAVTQERDRLAVTLDGEMRARIDAEAALTLEQQAHAATRAALAACRAEHPTDPEEPPAPARRALIGMSADDWPARLSDVGPGLQARRIFGQQSDFTNPSSIITKANSALADGMYPVISIKAPNWSSVAGGSYDAQLRAIANRLTDLPGRSFVCLNHEPFDNGTPADFSAMQRRALPILNWYDNVDAGVIANGWWWSDRTGQKLTDAQIAAWLPADVLALCDIVAGDFYQANETGEYATVKIKNFAAWAERMDIDRLGIGEYNSFTTSDLVSAGDFVLGNPDFEFACIWNTEGPRSRILTGARLTAFQNTLAKANA